MRAWCEMHVAQRRGNGKSRAKDSQEDEGIVYRYIGKEPDHGVEQKSQKPLQKRHRGYHGRAILAFDALVNECAQYRHPHQLASDDEKEGRDDEPKLMHDPQRHKQHRRNNRGKRKQPPDPESTLEHLHVREEDGRKQVETRPEEAQLLHIKPCALRGRLIEPEPEESYRRNGDRSEEHTSELQ